MSVQSVATGSEATSKMSARTRDRLLSVISPLALLALWEFCARFGFIDTRFFPAPSSVVSTMVEMLRSGELVTHTAVSMQRLLYGTILGGVLNRIPESMTQPTYGSYNGRRSVNRYDDADRELAALREEASRSSRTSSRA